MPTEFLLPSKSDWREEADRTAVAALSPPRNAPPLKEFIAGGWHVVEPGFPLIWGYHLDAICEHLEAVKQGHIRDLIINIPPGHAKSVVIGVFFHPWMWLDRPEWRSLNSSYDQSLVTRDSTRSREVIESEWYQKEFAPPWRLSKAQNTKTFFKNNKQGFRFCHTVAGRGTGHRGDAIICLHGSVKLTTDHGNIAIAEIVDKQLPVKVLGSSGTWQTIEAYEKSPGKPLLEIHTDDGGQLICTEDHPIFIVGRGYVPAIEAIRYSYGPLYMRSLRCGVQSRTRSRHQTKRRVLFPCVRSHQINGRAKSRMARRISHAHVPHLQQRVLIQAGRSASKALLLQGVSGHRSKSGEHARMPVVPDQLSCQLLPEKVLLARVRVGSTTNKNPRRKQRSVPSRRLDDGIRPRIHTKAEGPNSRTRRSCLRSLRLQNAIAGASYRRVKGQSRPHQSCDALRVVPSSGTHENRHTAGLDGPTRIVFVARRPTPDAVYNVRVAPDHDYYANGLLTHNCDDPHNVRHRHSIKKREAAIDWWNRTMPTRLNDPRSGVRIMIMQRVHEEDLTAQFLKADGVVHLFLTSRFVPERKCVTFIVDKDTKRRREFWKDWRTQRGELLFPKLFTPEVLDNLEKTLGSVDFEAQHQQNPVPAEGGIFKEYNWRFWCRPGMSLPPVKVALADGSVQEIEAEPLPEQFDKVAQSWDLTFKKKKTSDYVVGQVIARKLASFFLLHQVRDRMGFNQSVAAIKDVTEQWPETQSKYIEDKANGSAILDYLHHEVSGMVPVEPRGDKEERAWAIEPIQRSGNIYLPHPDMTGFAWVRDFLGEAKAFPNGTNDDQIDALSQGVDQLQNEAIPDTVPILPHLRMTFTDR